MNQIRFHIALKAYAATHKDIKEIFKFLIKLYRFLAWAWWLTPVIPALWEAKAGKPHEVWSSRPAWPT